METFVPAREFVDDPKFEKRRIKSLKNLDMSAIDRPIADIISTLSQIPYCYTLQCCWGHFVHSGQPDRYGLQALANYKEDTTVEYRIAYLGICLRPDADGLSLREDLESVVQIDPEYIQFGCGDWFWRRYPNSYALQVEPERFRDKDTALVSITEALHLQEVRNRMFERIREISLRHAKE